MNNNPLILIVDDNPLNLQFLGNILSQHEYAVGIAQDGKQALKFISTKLPDLILLDIMMPNLNGYEVCKKLKKDDYTKHIPIIFLTAKTDPKEIVKGFEAGAVDYVTKPFNSAELLARVKTHIEMKMLRGLIPICSKCKSIRNEEGIWEKIEEYVTQHSDALLSHSLCPNCMEDLYGKKEWYKKMKQKDKK